ncbi:MAG: leucine-rich repeat domain-containing protein [Planctomycetota bacterium]
MVFSTTLLLVHARRRFVFSAACACAVWIGIAGSGSTAQAQDLFPDKALEAAVRKEVFEKRYNSEPITAEDVKNISQVVGKGKGIKSLEGLQHCKSLMKLDLENNEITDLAPIRELKLLQSIDLASNKIQSLEPISGLTAVQYLHIANNGLEDLSPLTGMVKMQSLYASGNKFKKLEPILPLKKLWTLDVSGSPIEDAGVIGELKGLQTINIKGCAIKSLEFTRSLREVRLLIASGNENLDLNPLADACEADAQGDRRFAPYLRLYLDDTLLKNEPQATAVGRLQKVGVRINPPVR